MIEKTKNLFKNNKKNIFKISISAFILIILYYSINKQFKDLDIKASINILININKIDLFLIFILATVAVLSMCLYDYFIVKEMNLNIKLLDYLKISWIANTFNNSFNLGGITGTGLRIALYKNKTKDKINFKYPMFVLFTSTATGLSFFSLLIMLGILDIKNIIYQNHLYTIVLIIFTLYLPLYFCMDKSKWLKNKFFNNQKNHIEKPNLRIKMFLASVIEWFMASILLWIIINKFTNSLNLLKTIGIFSLASSVGILSFIPSGLGSMDAILLLQLKSIGISTNKSLVILILFRIFYYIIPWIIGCILAIWEIFFTNKQKDFQKNKIPIFNSIKKFCSLPFHFKIISDIGIFIVSIFIFICGLTLIFSCIFQGESKYIRSLNYIYIIQLAHIISLISGIILMGLSREIRLRVKRSYNITIIFLIIGALSTLIKDIDYKTTITILFLMGILLFLRSHFYRKSVPITKKSIVFLILSTSFCTLIYIIFAPEIQTMLLNEKFITKKLFLKTDVFTYNGLLCFCISWTFLFIWNSTKPKLPFNKKLDNHNIDKVLNFLQNNKGNTTTHLIFLKDKYLYWTKNGKILIDYSKINNCLVVLGDPIGNKEYINDGIVEFQEFADTFGFDTAFYRISKNNLPLYHEKGYYFFKLGEEAIIHLNNFDLKGKKKQNLRTAKNKFERNNYSFEMLFPPFSNNLLKELEKISNNWLGTKKENKFSMGWFYIDYLQKAPIAIIKDETNKIIAFCSMLPAYDNNKTISIDLMRFNKDSPKGIMDILFLYIILWAKDMGYEYFSIGMAPLANVGTSAHSHLQEKLAKVVFDYGNHWYSFKGLRKFKEKFGPIWEPKYFAYTKFSSLPSLIFDLTRYISKPYKNR